MPLDRTCVILCGHNGNRGNTMAESASMKPGDKIFIKGLKNIKGKLVFMDDSSIKDAELLVTHTSTEKPIKPFICDGHNNENHTEEV